MHECPDSLDVIELDPVMDVHSFAHEIVCREFVEALALEYGQRPVTDHLVVLKLVPRRQPAYKVPV
jgi:hypothetical protein